MRLDVEANRCFVCGPGNEQGLNVRFRVEDGVCRAECTPGPAHIGYEGVTHGGIIFSLLDDVMANWLWLQGYKCFTARADIRYRQSLPAETPVRLEGRLLRRKGRLALMHGALYRADTDELVAEANGSFMVAES
jgi:acyl-coenzyme A thioesterase PaaI-like protein